MLLYVRICFTAFSKNVTIISTTTSLFCKHKSPYKLNTPITWFAKVRPTIVGADELICFVSVAI